MVGWIPKGKRDKKMILNACHECTPLDTTNCYQGDPLRPRKSLDVVQRIKQAKKKMCVIE